MIGIAHATLIALLVGTYLLYNGAELLNLSYAAQKARDNVQWVRETCGVEDLERLLRYERATTGLRVLTNTWMLGVVLVFLYGGGLSSAVQLSEQLPGPEWVRGTALFVGLIAGSYLVKLPFTAFSTFVIEENFGFNNQSLCDFVLLQLKLFGVILFVYTPLVGIVLFIISNTALWWLYGAVFVSLFFVVLITASPYVIMPLFFEFERLESGEAYEAIQDVLSRADVECDEAYKIDGSRYSDHSNAYFIGFGPFKHIGLFDTLFDHVGISGIKSVFAHEVGHYRHGHMWKDLVSTTAMIFIGFYTASVLASSSTVHMMFDLSPAYPGLLIVALILSEVNELLAPLKNTMSRYMEWQADQYAIDLLGTDFDTDGLGYLVGENLSNPFAHPLYSTLKHTHPTPHERIEFAREQLDEG